MVDFPHWFLGPKPPAGAHPQDIIVCFLYSDSYKSLLRNMCNKSTVDYKGEEIVIFLILP